jgi:hypothetical protein
MEAQRQQRAGEPMTHFRVIHMLTITQAAAHPIPKRPPNGSRATQLCPADTEEQLTIGTSPALSMQPR